MKKKNKKKKKKKRSQKWFHPLINDHFNAPHGPKV